ncbi:hypothetical protein AQAU111925_13255 [Aquirufa aurantiipilula]
MVCVSPAVTLAVPVMTNRLTVPGFTVTLALVAAVPVAGVKVNVPVPEVPVKVNPKLLKLATPLTKSLLFVNLSVPDNPVIPPVKVVLTVTLFVDALNATVLP